MCPEFERMLIRSGIRLINFLFSVPDEEQERRFQDRIDDPRKRWKLSPMDLEAKPSLGRVLAGERHGYEALPWFVVPSDDPCPQTK